MPLTPADVHNVAFKKPPIGKRGYDEEEVDAFLDVVESELARLIEENNELRGRKDGTSSAAGSGAGDGRVEELNGDLEAAREENGRLQKHISELERALSQGNDGAQQQVVELQQRIAQLEQQLAESRSQLEAAQRAVPAASQRAAGDGEGGDDAHHAVTVLTLAQRTADELLAQSRAEADRLLSEARQHHETTINDAQSRAAQQLSEAEARAQQLDEESTARAQRTIQEAEQRAAAAAAEFEQRRGGLERAIEELRMFEREYRSRLRSYLESQLRDLDAGGRSEPVAVGEMADAQQH
jgi:DivIVA domain-containing protein